MQHFLWILPVLLALWFGVPLVFAKWARFRLDRRTRRARICVLSFDDGPGKTLTPAVLDFLSERRFPAVFFLLGEKLEDPELREIAGRLSLAGYEIGSHGYAHLHHWKSLPWVGIKDIRKGWRILERELGLEGPRLPFRPPYGKLNLASLLFLLFHRTPIVWWTIDSHDTYGREGSRPSDAAEKLFKRGGGVILLHDFERTDPSAERFVMDCLSSLSDRKPEAAPVFGTLRQLGILSGH